MNPHCSICQNPDLATMISLAWDGKMSLLAISGVLGGDPRVEAISKHLKKDVPGSWTRQIDAEPKVMRQRVYDLQRKLLDEVERRIALAEERARLMNEADPDEQHDWSEYFDLLDKDMQAAVGSIIKTQVLTEKREIAQAGLAIGLYELMLGGGSGKGMLAPLRLVGGDDDVIEGDSVEVD